MISTRPFISKSSRPFINLLVIVPKAPIIIRINVTFMIHPFFNFLSRSTYSTFFSLSFNFILWSAGKAKTTILQVLFFCLLFIYLFFLLLVITRYDRQIEIKRSVWMSKSQCCLWVSFSRTDYYYYYYKTPLWVFQTTISWWSFTGVWVITSFRKSPGLFSVFWPILTVLSSGWSPLVFLFPILPVPVPSLWWLYRAHRFRLVSPSISCSIVFFSSQIRSRNSVFALLRFTLWSGGTFHCFLLSISVSGRLVEISWSVLYQNSREFCVSRSPGRTPCCAYNICSHCQT